MTPLTWAEIGDRWPDAAVAWDRDVAPTMRYDLTFRDRNGTLWADDQFWHMAPKRYPERWILAGRAECNCRIWTDGQWIDHRSWTRRRDG